MAACNLSHSCMVCNWARAYKRNSELGKGNRNFVIKTLISLSNIQVAYFLAIFPYIVLIILLIRAVTLEGAMKGIRYFLIPDLDKIWDAELWYAAVTQVFYALGICFGSIIMYSSYNRFDQNVYR